MTLQRILERKTLFLIFSFLFLAVVGLLWLALLLLMIISLYKWLNGRKAIKNSFFTGMLCLMLGVCALAILTRLFILEIYIVPSGSMEDSIFTGDKILVSKLNYGPKIPQSPFDIPWINLWFYHSVDKNINTDSAYWKYRRLSGFSSIQRGDVMVFKKLKSDKKFLVKRCMVLPGESIKISNGDIFINNHKVRLYSTVKQHYQALLKNEVLFRNIADSLNLAYTIKENGDRDLVDCYLNFKETALIKATGCLDSLTYQALTYEAYPQQHNINWSLDNFGPITVPAKGVSLALNERNYLLYKSVLSEEGALLKFENSIFYINNVPASHYVFKYNYYFVMGDNRSDSIDSRFWGFVSENTIEGRVICSFFCKNKANQFVVAKLL